MAKHKRLKSIREYIYDKGEMIEQMFSSIPIVEVRNMVPIKLQGMPLHELKAECLVELLEMSDREIISILEGKKTRDPSSSESESGGVVLISDDEKRIKKERRSAQRSDSRSDRRSNARRDWRPDLRRADSSSPEQRVVVISDDEKRIKKEKRSDWRSAVRREDKNGCTTEQSTSSRKKNKRNSKEDDDPRNRKKKKVDSRLLVPSSSKDGQTSKEISKKKKDAKAPEKSKLSVKDVVVLDDISSSEETEHEGVKKTGTKTTGEKRAGEKRSGEKSLLDLLELEMRARAIRSLLRKEEDIQAEKILSEYKDEPDDLIPVEVPPPQVDLLSDSDDDLGKDEPVVEPSSSSCLQMDVESGDALSLKDVDDLETLLNIKNKKESSEVRGVIEVDEASIEFVQVNLPGNEDVTRIDSNKRSATEDVTRKLVTSKDSSTPVIESPRPPSMVCNTDCDVAIKVEEYLDEPNEYQQSEDPAVKAIRTVAELSSHIISKPSTNPGIIGVCTPKSPASGQECLIELSSNMESAPPSKIEQSVSHVQVYEFSVPPDKFTEGNVATVVKNEPMSEVLPCYSGDEIASTTNIVALKKNSQNVSILPNQCQLSSKTQERLPSRTIENDDEKSDGHPCVSHLEDDKLIDRLSGEMHEASDAGDKFYLESSGISLLSEPSSSPLEIRKPRSVFAGEDYHSNFDEDILDYDYDPSLNNPEKGGLHSKAALQSSPLREAQRDEGEFADDEDDRIKNMDEYTANNEQFDQSEISENPKPEVVEHSTVNGKLNSNYPADACSNVVTKNPNPNENTGVSGCIQPKGLNACSQCGGGKSLVTDNERNSPKECVGDLIDDPSNEQYDLGLLEALSPRSIMEHQEDNDSSVIGQQVQTHVETVCHLDHVRHNQFPSREENVTPSGHEALELSGVEFPKIVADEEDKDSSIVDNVNLSSNKDSPVQLKQGAFKHVEKEQLYFLVNDALGSPVTISPKSTPKSQELNDSKSSKNCRYGHLDEGDVTNIDRHGHHDKLPSMEEHISLSDHESLDFSNLESSKTVAYRQEPHDSTLQENLHCSLKQDPTQFEERARKNVLVEEKHLDFLVDDALGSTVATSPRSALKNQEHSETDSFENSQHGYMEGEDVTHVAQDHHDKVPVKEENLSLLDRVSLDFSNVESPKIATDEENDSSVEGIVHCSSNEDGLAQLKQEESQNVLVEKQQLPFLVDNALGSPALVFPRSTPKSQELNETESFKNSQRDTINGQETSYKDEHRHIKLSSYEKRRTLLDNEQLGLSDTKPPKIVAERQERHKLSVEENIHCSLNEDDPPRLEQKSSKNIIIKHEQLDSVENEAPCSPAVESPRSPMENLEENESDSAMVSQPRRKRGEAGFRLYPVLKVKPSRRGENITPSDHDSLDFSDAGSSEVMTDRQEFFNFATKESAHCSLNEGQAQLEQGVCKNVFVFEEDQPEFSVDDGPGSPEAESSGRVVTTQDCDDSNSSMNSKLEKIDVEKTARVNENHLNKHPNNEEQTPSYVESPKILSEGRESDDETTAFVGCNSIETQKKVQVTDGQAVRRTVILDGGPDEVAIGKIISKEQIGYGYGMDYVVVSSEDECELHNVNSNEEHRVESIDCSSENNPRFENHHSPACRATKASVDPYDSQKLPNHQDSQTHRHGVINCDVIISSDEHTSSSHGNPCLEYVLSAVTKALGLEPTQCSSTTNQVTDAMKRENNNPEGDKINQEFKNGTSSERPITHGVKYLEKSSSVLGIPRPFQIPSPRTSLSRMELLQSSLVIEAKIDGLETGNNNCEVIEIDEGDSNGGIIEEEQNTRSTKCLEETTSINSCLLSVPFHSSKASSLEPLRSSLIVEVGSTGNNNSEVIEIDDEDSGGGSCEEDHASHRSEGSEETSSLQRDSCPLSVLTTDESCLEPTQTSLSVDARTDVLENGKNGSEVIEIVDENDEVVSSDSSSEGEQSYGDTSESSSESDEESHCTVHSISDDDVPVRTELSQGVLGSSMEVVTECITEEVSGKLKQQSVELINISQEALTRGSITAHKKVMDDVIHISDSEDENSLKPGSVIQRVASSCNRSLESSAANLEIAGADSSALPQNVEDHVIDSMHNILNTELNVVSCINDIHSLQMADVSTSDINGDPVEYTKNGPSKESDPLEKELEEGEIEGSDSLVEISEDEACQSSKGHSGASSVALLHFHKQRAMSSTDSENSVDASHKRRGKKRLKLRKKRRKLISGSEQSTKRKDVVSRDQEKHLPEDRPGGLPTAIMEESQHLTSSVSKQTLDDSGTILIEDEDEQIVQAITEHMPPEILELDDSDETKTNWTARWLESSHVKKVVTTSKILMNARKKLKMKLKGKELPEIEAAPPLVGAPQLIGSVEEYHRLVKEGVITSSSKPDGSKESCVDTRLDNVAVADRSEAAPIIVVASDTSADKMNYENVGKSNTSQEISVNTLENTRACDPLVSIDQPCQKPAALEKGLEEREVKDSDSTGSPSSFVASLNCQTTQPILTSRSSTDEGSRNDAAVLKDDGKCRESLISETAAVCDSKIEVSDLQLSVSETCIIEENGNKCSKPVDTDPLSSSIKSFYEMMNPNQVLGAHLSSKSQPLNPFPISVSNRNDGDCNRLVYPQPSSSPSAVCFTITEKTDEPNEVGYASHSISPPHITYETTQETLSIALGSHCPSIASRLTPQPALDLQPVSENELEEGEIADSDVESSKCVTTVVKNQSNISLSIKNVAASSSSAAVSSAPSVWDTSLESHSIKLSERPTGSPSSRAECISTSTNRSVPTPKVYEPEQSTSASVVQPGVVGNTTICSSLPSLSSSSSHTIGQPTPNVQCGNTAGDSTIANPSYTVRTISHSTLSSVIPPSYTIPQDPATLLVVNSALQNTSPSGVHAAIPAMNQIQAASAEMSNLYQYRGPPSGSVNPQVSVNVNSSLHMYDAYYSWMYSQGLSGSLNSNYGYGAPNTHQDASVVYRQWGEYYKNLMEACQDSAARANVSNIFASIPPKLEDTKGYSWVFERPNQTPAQMNPEILDIVQNVVEPVQNRSPSEEWNFRFGLKGLLNEHFVTPGAMPKPALAPPASSDPARGGLSRRRPSRRGRRKKKK